MKTLQINTTQNVLINFEVSDVGKRLLAFILDNVLKGAYLYLIFEILGAGSIDLIMEDDYWSQKAIFIIIMLPVTFYTLTFEILMNGQTLGKKIMNIRVVNIDGFKPSKSDYVIRWFMRVVDFNFFILIAVYAHALGFLNGYTSTIIAFFFFGKMLGFLSILVTKNNQRFGDIAGNTVVIDLRDATKFSQTILENISDVYKPTYPNVIKLSDNDLRIIKEYFTNSRKTRDHVTLIKLREKIIDVTGIEKVHNSDVEFIDTVLKDYNFYTQNM